MLSCSVEMAWELMAGEREVQDRTWYLTSVYVVGGLRREKYQEGEVTALDLFIYMTAAGTPIRKRQTVPWPRMTQSSSS